MWLGAGRGASHAIVALWGTGRGGGHIHQRHHLPGFGLQRRGMGPHQHRGRRQELPVRRRPVASRPISAPGRCSRSGTAPTPRPTRCPDPDSEEWVGVVSWRRLEANEAAEAALDQAAAYFGVGAANLVNLFNPEKIIIGGWLGLTSSARRCWSKIRKARERPGLEYTASRVTIEVGQLGAEAVALGASTLVVDELLANGGTPPVWAPPGPGKLRLS